ncbi:MAG: ribulose-phosphate 3-epimerase [Eubacteriales bacterium]
MKEIVFSASMMCANFASLEREVHGLQEGKIDSFHLDVMDGLFVDNFGMGFQDMEYIRSATKIPLEGHLMIQNPERYFRILEKLRLDVVYIHPESTQCPEIALEDLRKMGIAPGIAVNPGTSIAQIEELLYIADRVLVMCVIPGHAGREFAPYVAKKIDKLLAMKEEIGFELHWDGACTEEKVLEYAPKGVDGFVLGTSLLFGKNRPYPELLHEIRGKLPKN